MKEPITNKPSQIRGSWGIYVQSGDFQEIDSLGRQLSIVLDCPCHYPAWNKKLYECHCNITFPYYMVKAAYDSGDWSTILRVHKDEEMEKVSSNIIKES